MSAWPLITALILLGVLASPPVRADADLPLLVQAEAQTIAPFCAGRDVRIEGNHNAITLAGRCRSLLLKGIANTVSLDLGAGAAIRIEGAANHVTYRATAAANVEALGPDVTVTAVLPPASGAGPGLALDGSDASLAADCADRDVTVRGDRSLYLLRGGCRSVTVQGNLVIVQAELQPGAAIIIAGHGSRVGWAMSGPGRPPAATIHGEASRVERLDAIGGLPVRQ